MELQGFKSDVQTSDNVIKKQFNIDQKSIGILLKGFSDSLYSNKIGAIVREISSNCYDANVEAGNKDALIEIEFNTSGLDYSISFIDKGIGINRERMEAIFSNYFASTKRSNNDQIGGFGIGSKSPFSYTSVFNIQTIYQEGSVRIKDKYILSRGVDCPEYVLLASDETEEETGTRVIIPVQSEDIGDFVREILSQLRFFENIKLSNITSIPDYYSTKLKEFAESTVVETDSFILSSIESSNSFGICLGRVYYELSSTFISKIAENLNKNDRFIELLRKTTYISQTKIEKQIEDLNIAIKFDVGEITPTLNRESIEMSEYNISIITEKFIDSILKIQDIIQRGDIERPKDTVEAYNRLKDKSTTLRIGNIKLNVSILDIKPNPLYYIPEKLGNDLNTDILIESVEFLLTKTFFRAYAAFKGRGQLRFSRDSAFNCLLRTIKGIDPPFKLMIASREVRFGEWIKSSPQAGSRKGLIGLINSAQTTVDKLFELVVFENTKEGQVHTEEQLEKFKKVVTLVYIDVIAKLSTTLEHFVGVDPKIRTNKVKAASTKVKTTKPTKQISNTFSALRAMQIVDRYQNQFGLMLDIIRETENFRSYKSATTLKSITRTKGAIEEAKKGKRIIVFGKKEDKKAMILLAHRYGIREVNPAAKRMDLIIVSNQTYKILESNKAGGLIDIKSYVNKKFKDICEFLAALHIFGSSLKAPNRRIEYTMFADCKSSTLPNVAYMHYVIEEAAKAFYPYLSDTLQKRLRHEYLSISSFTFYGADREDPVEFYTGIQIMDMMIRKANIEKISAKVGNFYLGKARTEKEIIDAIKTEIIERIKSTDTNLEKPISTVLEIVYSCKAVLAIIDSDEFKKTYYKHKVVSELKALISNKTQKTLATLTTLEQ